jgi:hypothetical protein
VTESATLKRERVRHPATIVSDMTLTLTLIRPLLCDRGTVANNAPTSRGAFVLQMQIFRLGAPFFQSANPRRGLGEFLTE